MIMYISLFLQEFIDTHNLSGIVDSDGFICIEIQDGMHGLFQAGRLAYNELVQHLAPHGHGPVQFTPSLWTNKHLNIAFTLVVNDFGI